MTHNNVNKYEDATEFAALTAYSVKWTNGFYEVVLAKNEEDARDKANQPRSDFPEMCFLVWEMFPHHVGAFWTLLEPPKCHIMQNPNSF